MAAIHDDAHDERSGHDDHAGHNHTHVPKSFGTAFAVGVALNLAFVLIEAGYGISSKSMALLADAGHNLSDVLGLRVAWGASVLSQRPPCKQYTYGLRGSSILAALFNAVFLLIAVGAIGWEAIMRFFSPEAVAGKTVMAVAAVGIAVNGLTAWLFAAGARGDINIRGTFLHMVADAAVSAGVVLAGLVMLYTGWLWLDPLVSLLIVAVIVWGTWSLLRESLAMSMSAVPAGVDAAAVETYLAGLPGVSAQHDLHIWPMSTTETALTAHLVMPKGHPGDAFLIETAHELAHRFGIGHATIQVEVREDTVCALAPAGVV